MMSYEQFIWWLKGYLAANEKGLTVENIQRIELQMRYITTTPAEATTLKQIQGTLQPTPYGQSSVYDFPRGKGIVSC